MEVFQVALDLPNLTSKARVTIIAYQWCVGSKGIDTTTWPWVPIPVSVWPETHLHGPEGPCNNLPKPLPCVL